MPYSVWVLPDGKHEEREHVQSYENTTQAQPDMDYLRGRLPKEDTVTGDWSTPNENTKRFDWHRLTEPTNAPQPEGGT